MGIFSSIIKGVTKFVPKLLGFSGGSGGSGGSGDFLGNLAKGGIQDYLTGSLDYRFNRRAAEDNLARLRAMGLTPQEIVGSGAGGGINAAGPTLGNHSAIQLAQQKSEREKDRELERQKMQTSLAQSQIQANATLGAAQTSAQASIHSTDTKANTDANRLKFDQQQFELTLQKHPHQMKKLVNEAETSSAGFIKYMKTLGMSAENLKATAIYQKWNEQGFDILDPKDWRSASKGDRVEVLRELAAHASSLYNDASGVAHNLKHGYQGMKDTVQQWFQ